MMKKPCDTCSRDCPEHGCAQWRSWFVENWNENICTNHRAKPRQTFRYEHPDREREMKMAEFLVKAVTGEEIE